MKNVTTWLLTALSKGATAKWASRQKGNVAKFDTAGETCHAAVNRQDALFAACMISHLVLVVVGLIALNKFVCQFDVLANLCVGIVAFGCLANWLCRVTKDDLGSSTIDAAVNWRCIRPQLVNTGMFQKILDRVTRNDFELRAFQEDEQRLMRSVVEIFENQLYDLCKEVERTEINGQPSKKAAARKQLGAIHHVAQELNLPVKEDWGSYFPTKPTVKVSLAK